MSNPRDRILARRAKFMAAAIVGIAGCSSESTTTTSPQACLKVAPDAALDAADAADTQPQVCLSPEPPDSALDTAITDTADDAATDGG
jgi:hypothetical protein